MKALQQICKNPIMGAILGTMFFLLIFPPEIINPYYIDWLLSDTDGNTDQAQHFIGWLFFQQTPWSFPLGQIPKYFAPIGSYVAYTDSIPWLAVTMKALIGNSQVPFQYSGAWLLFCYAAMGFFAHRLLSYMTKDLPTIIMGVLFFVASPALLDRTIHIALCAHWLIIATLCWYFEYMTHNRKIKQSAYIGTLLCMLATCTHPYIGAMCSGMVLIPVLFKNSIKYKIFTSLAILSGNFFMLFIFGYLPTPIQLKGGSHYWSADFFTFLNSMDHSYILSGFTLWGGQYEGFAFLGTGGIILFFLTIYKTGFSKIFEKIKQSPLLISLILLFVFGLSYHIRFFSKWIISIEFLYIPLQSLASSFRSSGRFVWPLYYFIFAVSTTYLHRYYSKNKARSILFACLIIQAICQLPYLIQNPRIHPVKFKHEDYAKLSPLFKNKKSLKIIPPVINYHECTVEPVLPGFWVPLAYYAGLHNTTINSGSIANLSGKLAHPHCQKQQDEFLAKIDEDTLYVLRKKWEEKHQDYVNQHLQCQNIGLYRVCIDTPHG